MCFGKRKKHAISINFNAHCIILRLIGDVQYSYEVKLLLSCDNKNCIVILHYEKHPKNNLVQLTTISNMLNNDLQ